MALRAVLEPLIVVSLLAFGTIVNRNRSRAVLARSPLSSSRPDPWQHLKYTAGPVDEDVETGRRSKEDDRTLLPLSLSRSSTSSSSTLAEDLSTDSRSTSKWHQRRLRFMGWEKEVTTPNTDIFRDRFLSRVLQRFPFLAEVWYWALIYWVCGPATHPTIFTLRLWVSLLLTHF
jgi:hypothetical protein